MRPYPKEKELRDFEGHKRKWKLVKTYGDFGLYESGNIRECFRPFDLDMIEKKDVKHRGGAEGTYWKVGNTKSMRDYLEIYYKEIE